VIPKMLQVVQGCQALEIPVLPTLQVPGKLGAIHPDLAEHLKNETPISKTAFSAIREPEFLLALRQTGKNQVLLTGIETHVCVLQTGLDLLDADYQVFVLADAVFSRTDENYRLGLQRLHDAGGIITSVEMALFELIRTSKHPQFRTISKLIK
jgi:nicotinamidase-related amidase